MKKILLIIAFILCIFQMVVLATAIDIGSAAINRNSSVTYGYTLINKDNPANESGKITSVDIWANVSLTSCQIATFFVVSGDNLSTRDTYYIGTVQLGFKRTFTVDLDVQAGDYIGIYYPSGEIESNDTGYSGVWFSSGDLIPCTNHGFSTQSGDTMSLYGIGATTPAGVTWNGIVITKWNGIEITIPLNTQ